MRGFITESNLREADEAFPGIARYFDSLVDKPRTFLELVSMFDHWTQHDRVITTKVDCRDPQRASAPATSSSMTKC